MSPCSAINQCYDHGVQLRYNFRLYPTAGQRQALANAFGCARVVFNDALRARREAHAAGLPYISDGELSTEQSPTFVNGLLGRIVKLKPSLSG